MKLKAKIANLAKCVVYFIPDDLLGFFEGLSRLSLLSTCHLEHSWPTKESLYRHER